MADPPPLVPTAAELPWGPPVGVSDHPTRASTMARAAALAFFSAPELLRSQDRNCMYWLMSPQVTGPLSGQGSVDEANGPHEL